MSLTGLECSEHDFIGHFVQNASQMMWFLGAGTSRTAGMPTATDIIWDLKRKYYCLKENQNVQSHDLNNAAIRQKIQNYLHSKGFPPLWTPEEYSFYFELTFGGDYAAQQKYINDQLAAEKVSLNVGHRAFGAMLAMGATKLAFTTNFDQVVENGFSFVAGKDLSTFHLEGAYAALEALNAERFPIYAKVHGDFRFQSIKNLAADLLHNDREIQKCFLAAATRYGAVVSGYSGRDANVMAMFAAAIEQNNALPQGLYWTVTNTAFIAKSVVELIQFARSRGVKAFIVETGTFDIMLSKLWRQLPKKPEDLDLKVRTAKAKPVSVPLPPPGKNYPILRTNALPVLECPQQCAVLEHKTAISFKDVNDRVFEQKPQAVMCFTDRILFWGNAKSAASLFDTKNIGDIKPYDFKQEGISIETSTILKAFFENALAHALSEGKPLKLRRKGKRYFAVVDHDYRDDKRLEPLKKALGYKGSLADLTGSVGGLHETFWAEAISISLELRNNALWLMLEPDIWISPLKQRENAIELLRTKRLRRYNTQASNLLSEWINLLLGAVGEHEVVVSCFAKDEFPACFKLNTRTAFSYRGGPNGR
ncbi:MAG: SIR2 family protein [Verrucomicrobia bacterium]|nr:SIR2 family protein [Verrucomicrobiota bacterium]